LFYLEHGGEEAYREKVQSMQKTIQNKSPIALAKDATSDEAYHLDIYYKGAYIMHSLRFILGDEVFFPLLKAFLSDEKYIYSNLVKTKDFTDFVQQYSSIDLEGFFQLYLYTAELPEVKIQKKRGNQYAVSIKYIDFALPINIHTSEGIQRLEISSQPTLVQSTSPIQVDPEDWYLNQQEYIAITALLIHIVAAILWILIGTSRLKINPLICLVTASIWVGLAAGLDFLEALGEFSKGFGTLIGQIGLIIILGCLLGVVLERSRAAFVLAQVIWQYLGRKIPALSTALMGYLVGIPVFCDSGFIFLNPIGKNLAKTSGISPLTFSLSLAGGLY